MQVISISEMTNGQMIVGLTRFSMAIVRSYGLAFGAVLGIGLAAFGGEERFTAILVPCTEKSHQIDSKAWMALFYPICCLAALMQMRVALRHYLICLIIQAAAYGFQLLFSSELAYSDFVADVLATLIAALVAQLCLFVMNYLHLSDLSEYRFGKSGSEADEIGSETDAIHGTEEEEKKDEEEGGVDDAAPILNDHKSEQPRKSWGNPMYPKEDVHSFDQGDMWFCLLPALYLLVPGSSLLKTAIADLLDAAVGTASLTEHASLVVSFFLIGLSQVMGLKIGFFFLTIFFELKNWIKKLSAK